MPSGAIGCCGRIPSRVATCLVGRRCDVLAVEQDAAALGLEQPGQAAQQGGLAAGVGADDHGDLTGRDGEREAVDDDAVVVGEAKVLGGAGWGGGSWGRSWVLAGQPPAPIRLARASRKRR